MSKRKVKIADPETVAQLTGFAVGGVPPLGHVRPMQTLIDRSLSRFEIVHAAAGTSNTIFPIAYQTLIEVTKGEVHDLT